jgi:L-seryl-tRNA(Ser) seleniumtransferase
MTQRPASRLLADVRRDGALQPFGVARVINAGGPLSRLGGARVAPEVAAAMAEVAGLSVDTWRLQAAASARIAEACGAEAGLVTTGASAALTLAAAAILAGLDPARMQRLPETGDLPNEIIVPRTHRTGYDRAVTLAGARLVDVGVDDVGTGAGIRGLETWEVEAAIGARTAGILASASAQTEADLPVLAEVAKRARLPLIVDAAAQLPPRDNLRRYIAMGATLVAFSGGKAIGGPPGTGILAGRRDPIASAALQMLDLDVAPERFEAPEAFFPEGPPRALPRHGIGRGFKAGKEQVAGLLVALERFVTSDPSAAAAAAQARLQRISVALAGARGITVRREPQTHAERAQRLVVACDGTRISADTLVRRLAGMTPAVHLGEARAREGLLTIDLACVDPADDDQLAWSIRAAAGE